MKRAIQKLVEAKLIDETGDLHERRYKFYRVRWSLNEKPTFKATTVKNDSVAPAKSVPSAGMTKKEPKPMEYVPPSIDQSELLKDSRIAHYAELYGRVHQENLRRYKMEMLSLGHPDYRQDSSL